MVLILAGHQRSGTTILRRLCNQHPEITITGELACFAEMNTSLPHYIRYIFSQWPQRANRRELVWGSPSESQWCRQLHNHIFFARYVWHILWLRKYLVNVADIETALRRTVKEVRIVGDKYPDYIFHLDQLVALKELTVVVIYRDCRDVVNSTLKKARGDWQTLQPFVQEVDSAEKVARRWVKAIDLMESYAAHIHIIRYEDLVQHPDVVFATLGDRLGVDPEAFPKQSIKATSLGKYKHGLSAQELAQVMTIAGPTMTRLGYI